MAPSELGAVAAAPNEAERRPDEPVHLRQSIPNNQITERFIEAWAWLERKGFIVCRMST